MAYLNRDERAQLLNDLINMPFNRAKGKLNRMDRQGRIAYFRNMQESGRISTRFELTGLGTQVTLIEREVETPIDGRKDRNRSKFEMVEVVVEPTPENRT